MRDADYPGLEPDPTPNTEDAAFLRGRALSDAIVAAADREFASGTPVIYFVQAGDAGPIKIGYSGSFSGVRARVDSLQTGCPWPLVVRRVMEAPEKQLTERELHQHFGSYRLAGEWFAPAEPVVEMAGGNAVPLDAITRLLVASYDRGLIAGEARAAFAEQQRLVRHLRDLAERFDDSDADERWRRERFQAIEDLRRAA